MQGDTKGPVDAVRRQMLLRASSGVAAGLLVQTAMPAVSAAPSSTAGQPAVAQTAVTGSLNTADIVIEALIQWGVPFVFGVVGDGINPLIESLRKRQDKIRFIAVRHEEAAAFMASGYAKHTGKLGVCLATTGPGAVHLMNGLYDAKMDSAPVLAITGTTFHDLIGTQFMQSVNTVALMADVALYNVQLSGPIHAAIVCNVACRAALEGRGVAHLTIAKDTQNLPLGADKPSMENHGLQTSAQWRRPAPAASGAQLQGAADILNAGNKIAVLAGQGALGARSEVTQLAQRLGAPVAKALLGKAVLADDSPYTTGGIGHLGTIPSQFIMRECDTLLILGSTMPWVDFYPPQGKARAIQVDIKGEHIGLRYPVEVGLTGDVKATLTALLPLLKQKQSQDFLAQAQSRMRGWNSLLDQVAATHRSPLRPQMALRALSDALADDAVVSLDCGANTHFAARMLKLRERQALTGTGMLATMAPGMPFAIAAQLAFPGRQSVAVVGDGGFAQLMAELATAVKYHLPIKVVILKNNSLAEVRFEQKELGNPEYGCDLGPIDFVGFARACGAEGFRCGKPEEVQPAIKAFLNSPHPAILEVQVDPEEKPAMPQELKV